MGDPSAHAPWPPPDATLAGVHPKLRAIVLRVLSVMADLGHPMLVTAGVRTAEEQHALWLKGRNAAGQVIDPHAVVTNADGTHTRSNHQLHADGCGHAVDCAFLVNGQPSWDDHLPWRCYGEVGKVLGARWGGDWSKPFDQPHLELLDPPA